MTGPNRFLWNKSPHIEGTFGQITAISHMHHVTGLGHEEHLRVALEGGLVLEITQAFAIELARRLPESLAGLPGIADCSGALADFGEEA